MRELEAHKHNSPLNSGGNSHPQRFAHTAIIHIFKESRAIMILTTHDLVSIFPMIRKTRTPWDVGGYWVVPTGYTPAYEISFVGLYSKHLLFCLFVRGEPHSKILQTGFYHLCKLFIGAHRKELSYSGAQGEAIFYIFNHFYSTWLKLDQPTALFSKMYCVVKVLIVM